MQSFDQPLTYDPLMPYALPMSRPPVRPHTRHQRTYRSHRDENYHGERKLQRQRRSQVVLEEARARKSERSPIDYSDNGSRSDETLTDGSLESDASEALSADSFAFDDSISDMTQKQTVEAPAGPVQCGDKPAESMTGKKGDKPSPYNPFTTTVLQSRFVGDALAQWSCTAELSVLAPRDSVKLKKQSLFRWVYVLVAFDSSIADSLRHLQGQHPNLSSVMVSRLFPSGGKGGT